MMMKKRLLYTGITALICSFVSFLCGCWFRWVGGSVMDAETSFYSTAFRRYSIALDCSLIFLAAGIVLLLLYYLLKRRRR